VSRNLGRNTAGTRPGRRNLLRKFVENTLIDKINTSARAACVVSIYRNVVVTFIAGDSLPTDKPARREWQSGIPAIPVVFTVENGNAMVWEVGSVRTVILSTPAVVRHG
jgi:hypothetical protein